MIGASVHRNPRSVAIFGWIMPAPAGSQRGADKKWLCEKNTFGHACYCIGDIRRGWESVGRRKELWKGVCSAN